MRTRSDSDHEEPDVQMAPLIDCVFLLLIFFLVASTLKKPHKEIPIALPDAAHSKTTVLKYDTLVLEVTKDGQIYFEGQLMTQKSLHDNLRQAAEEQPGRPVRIDCDKNTAVQHFCYLADMCQFNGLNQVGIRTTNVSGKYAER